MSKIKAIILIVLVVCLLSAGGIFYYFNNTKQNRQKTLEDGLQEAFDKAIGLPEEAMDEIIDNPMENAPSVNPLEKVANPFDDSYKNPFAD